MKTVYKVTIEKEGRKKLKASWLMEALATKVESDDDSIYSIKVEKGKP